MVKGASALSAAVKDPTVRLVEAVWLTPYGGTLLVGVKNANWVRIDPHFALRTRGHHLTTQCANVKAWKALVAPDLVTATARVGEVFKPLSFADYNIYSISKSLYS